MTDLRLYLYGRADAAVWSLLRGHELQHMVADLLAGGAGGSPTAAGHVARAAVAHGLLAEEDGGYVPGSKMVLVPAAPEREVRDLVAPLLDRYAEAVAKVIPPVRKAYEATTAARRFSWQQVEHALVAGMLLDLAAGSELWRSGRIERQHWEAVVWAFEKVSAANSFGVQWIGHAPGRCACAQLWHRDVKRPDLKLDETMVACLGRLAVEGSSGNGPPEALLYLRYLKLLERDGGELRLAVPTFDAADFDRLLGPLLEGAARLVAAAVVPALDLVEAHPWWGRRGHDDSLRHAAVRLMLEYGVDRVVEEGLLQPFPRGAPEPWWGRWVWVEAGGPLTLVAGAFDGVGGETAAS